MPGKIKNATKHGNGPVTDLPKRDAGVSAAVLRDGLFVVAPGDFSGFRVDQMQPRAREARHRLVGVVPVGRIVRRQSLHLSSGVRATIKKRNHFVL